MYWLLVLTMWASSCERCWTKWQRLELPPGDDFNFARNACAQWLVQPDGTLLCLMRYAWTAPDQNGRIFLTPAPASAEFAA